MDSKIKIAFFDSKEYDEENFKSFEGTEYTFMFFRPKLTDKTVKLAEGYNAVCVFVNDDLSAQVLEQLSSYGVKLVALRCSGYNNVDLEAAQKLGIEVVRVPVYSPHSIAEHTAALILSLNRKIHRAYIRTRENNFSLQGLLGSDLYQKKVGVVGTGRIGKVFIKIMQGFGMDVLAFDKFPDTELQKSGVKYVALDELYIQSDVIALFCPLTPETHYLLSKTSFSKMKDGVMIINTGRGKLIDTEALIDALKSKKVGAAGLDVYEEESEYFFEDFSEEIVEDDTLSRLLTFNNVLVTAHQAFFTKEALGEISRITMKNIKEYFGCCGWSLAAKHFETLGLEAQK